MSIVKISIGIVGLPNVGKSTLFNQFTGQSVNAENYPFATIDPNVGVVAMPDDRLYKVAQIMDSKKVLPATLEFVDIAGLVKGAHEGKGLGNQFLARIRETDAILHIVRGFKDENVAHFEGRVDPAGDFNTVLEELKAASLSKPQVVLLNGEGNSDFADLILDIKKGVTKEDLRKLANLFLEKLDLITFFTANANEARSWFVKNGTKVPDAAAVVHNDFKDKFIKAEVINWQTLVETGGWQKAKQKGLVRLEGKDYTVQEGDIILVKI